MRRQGNRPFFVLDDATRLAALAGKLGLNVPVRELDRPAEAEHVFATALPVLPVRLRAPVKAGQPDPANAPATLEAIERAVELALAGEIAGMVTNPIQKKTLQDAGFRHPGHTEYLAELAGGVPVAMMLACPGPGRRRSRHRQDPKGRPVGGDRIEGLGRHRTAAARGGGPQSPRRRAGLD